MSLAVNKSALISLTKELMSRWYETKETWRDAKSLEFERHYLDELQSSVNTATSAIDQLDRLVTKIRKDCE